MGAESRSPNHKSRRLACPRCGSGDIHHSRLRSFIEQMRVQFTRRVPFRCHRCQWRGWLRDDASRPVASIRKIHRELTESELERLDPEQ